MKSQGEIRSHPPISTDKIPKQNPLPPPTDKPKAVYCEDEQSFNPQFFKNKLMEEQKLQQLEQIQRQKEELKQEEPVHKSKVKKPSSINKKKKRSGSRKRSQSPLINDQKSSDKDNNSNKIKERDKDQIQQQSPKQQQQNQQQQMFQQLKQSVFSNVSNDQASNNEESSFIALIKKQAQVLQQQQIQKRKDSSITQQDQTSQSIVNYNQSQDDLQSNISISVAAGQNNKIKSIPGQSQQAVSSQNQGSAVDRSRSVGGTAAGFTLNRQTSNMSQATTISNFVEYNINRRVGLQFKKCFLKRKPNHDLIGMDIPQRRQAELQAYHQFKQNKENADVLYLVDQKWIEKWIDYLRGNDESPDYINNEKLYKIIFEEMRAKFLKMNEDFIMVHKSLFEYLYGLYGCDYFIQAKQYQRQSVSRLSKSPHNNIGPNQGIVGQKTSEQSTQSSSLKNQHNFQDSVSHASYISATSSSFQNLRGQQVFLNQNQSSGLTVAQRIEDAKKQLQQQDLEASLSEGIVGLQNYAYFCYLNSCLQCLLAIDQLKYHFINREYRKFKDVSRIKNNFRLSLSFTKFYQDVWYKKNNQQYIQEMAGRKQQQIVVVSPDHVKQEIVNKFSPVFQHDCHEFFTYIMSNLQDEETPIQEKQNTDSDNLSAESSWNLFDQSHPSIIDKLFSGMQKTIVTCVKCERKSITYNPFMTLSMAFESSLDKCIVNYLKEDTLDSKDQYRCEKCNQCSKAKIKTEISKLPNVLVFHLKRFAFPSMKKIKGKIKYSNKLDMAKYCKNSKLDIEDTEYELFALTVHLGTLEQGHYVAYTKRNSKWILFNDEDFQYVKEADALSQEAYLLFYRKLTL